jgi:uncharacterized damage-inducible protein DinB
MADDNQIDALVSDYERSKTLTLAYIDAMPADKFGDRPAEGSRSFSEQMLHIAQGTIGLSGNGHGGARLYEGQNLEKDPTLQNKEAVTRIVTEAYDYAIEGIKNMDSASFDEIVERGPFKITRLAWVSKALEHANHHKGQCAVYLRMAGQTPPSYNLF